MNMLLAFTLSGLGVGMLLAAFVRLAERKK
jgi:hypothetical protein